MTDRRDVSQPREHRIAKRGANPLTLTEYGRAAYELLRLYAQRGDTDITWTHMCDTLGYAWVGLGPVLGDVAERCTANGEPDLSSLVCCKDGGPSTAWADRDVWEAERAACFAWTWSV